MPVKKDQNNMMTNPDAPVAVPASPKKDVIQSENAEDWLLINRVVTGKDFISTLAMKVPTRGAIHRVVVTREDAVVSVSDTFLPNVFTKEVILATTGKKRNTYTASM